MPWASIEHGTAFWRLSHGVAVLWHSMSLGSHSGSTFVTVEHHICSKYSSQVPCPFNPSLYSTETQSFPAQHTTIVSVFQKHFFKLAVTQQTQWQDLSSSKPLSPPLPQSLQVLSTSLLWRTLPPSLKRRPFQQFSTLALRKSNLLRSKTLSRPANTHHRHSAPAVAAAAPAPALAPAPHLIARPRIAAAPTTITTPPTRIATLGPLTHHVTPPRPHLRTTAG